ncbi:MAG: GNAT family N-acetyltransferase [Chloroflexi bacterium]|nr:GNAT family N-acetyltransferase [Chloroflexota bacterium]
MEIRIEKGDLGSDTAAALISALNAELTERYPEPGDRSFRLDTEEVAPGRGAFFLAYVDSKAIGCGAIRRLTELEAEIKRMYVAPELRGRGIGRKLLDALESEARALGVRRLVLETGERQPEAIALYQHAGFGFIPLFGEYIGKAISVCMGKELAEK